MIEWYENDEDFLSACNYIQKFINFYCLGSTFSTVEDIKADNLGEFLKIMLKHYELYLFRDLQELIESIMEYFFRIYEKEFPDYQYPQYKEEDKRTLALNLMEMIDGQYTIFPEDVPYILKYLDTESAYISQANYDIQNYFKSFDIIQRTNIEFPKRWKAITEERLEAIKNNKPLPIRPMSIKLDPCYKKPN